MTLAIGLKFSEDGFTHYYQPTSERLATHDFCVVRDPELGERIGFVSCFEGRCDCQCRHLPRVLRRASEEEIARWYEDGVRQTQALRTARAKAQQHSLPMKIITVRFDDAQNLVLFQFTADHRIDFRELVRDLAGHFKSRIELWQVGTRREAADKDGFGCCGQRLCCSCWMKEFPAVSIRHARDQDLNHTPPKLSGMCGRLRCCLRYEHEAYCALGEHAPGIGAVVKHADGREGVVLDRNLLTGRALVRLDDAKPDWFEFAALTMLRAPQRQPRNGNGNGNGKGHGNGHAKNAAATPGEVEEDYIPDEHDDEP